MEYFTYLVSHEIAVCVTIGKKRLWQLPFHNEFSHRSAELLFCLFLRQYEEGIDYMSYKRFYMSWAFVELCQISLNARLCPVWTALLNRIVWYQSTVSKFSRLPSGKQWHIFIHSHPQFSHLFTWTKEFKRYNYSAYWESFHNTDYGHYHYSHPFLREGSWERAKNISQKHTKTTGDNVKQKKKNVHKFWPKQHNGIVKNQSFIGLL